MYPFQLPASRVNPAQRKRDRRPIFPSVTAGDAEFYKELWKPIRKIRIKRNKKKRATLYNLLCRILGNI